VLSVTQVDPLQAARHDDERDTWYSDYIDTAWVEIDGSFDDYWAARGKNLRQNMRKQRNKLAADGITTTMRVLREAGDMAGAIARYGVLESAGWKAGEGTAIHPDNDQGRFYTRLLEAAAARGEALVFEYLFGEQTAAINLCLMRGGTLVVLKTTYDERIPKTLSPAFLLREEELRHLHAGHEVRRIEYYGRVMDWHTKLTDRQRTLYHLTTYRWPLLKQLAQRRRAQEPAAPVAAPVPVVAEPAASAPEAR
jgi:Acetyltransferase (GNAT) domain